MERPEISVDKAILGGHLLINLPVILLIAGTPLLVYWLSPMFISYQFIQPAVLLALVPGFMLAWVWWSFLIVVWRKWAFGKVTKKNWPLLKKRAIVANLIWPDGSKFEKTEIRSESDESMIRAINEEIQRQFQTQQQLPALIKDDGTVADEISYYYQKRKIFTQLFYTLFIIGVGMYFFWRRDYWIGALVTATSAFSFDKKDLAKLRDEKAQLTINSAGILINIKGFGFTSWKDTDNIVIDTENGILNLDVLKGEASYAVVFPLSDLGIKDYGDFLFAVNIMLKRYEAENQD